jgi:glycosyltransferase involved in cell wall biosynthesis
MSLNELTETSQPDLARGRPCVVVAADNINQNLRVCLESTFAHTSTDVPVVVVCAKPAAALRDLLQQWMDGERSVWFAPAVAEPPGDDTDALTAAVDCVLSMLSPADIALLREPCRVTPRWLERLRDAAHADSNTATASALADVGAALALSDPDRPAGDLSTLADSLAVHTMTLRPRLSLAVGPCVYVRRDSLELVGSLDRGLELRWALEVDFAQRCLLSGLAHVAADDVVVGRLAPAGATDAELPGRLRERYPHLSQPVATAASGVLPRALEAARRPRSRLWVTLDARSLSATLTGTQRHILELIRALSATGGLRLRLVVSSDTSAANVELLRSLPQTELLPIESIDGATPRSTVFHRPQQVFGPPDLRLALRLGERIVLNQLDLIAYRNPGYHTDATAWRSHRRVSRQALAAAERVVVFSNHTRAELLSDELVDEERIRIVPPGLDHPSPGESRRPAALDEPPHSPPDDGGSPNGFLLCLGTDFRHKNRVFALRLLAALRERHGWEGRLVLAGTHIPNGSSLELEHSFLEQHSQLRQAVVELGAIDEEEKAWLMGHAAAVVYPSVYEGFGLVPFEAALSGVPCVFAPQSSLAEVLPADAAAIVPWNPEESADRTNALLTDPTARARNVETLAEAARRLTWTDAAAAMEEVYGEAAVAPVREAAALSQDEVERECELRELIAAHDALVARLVGEREHTQRMYDELNAEVGFGLSLIGPHGALSEDIQRALLALSARPALSRPLYGAASRVFRAARALGGGARDGSHRAK